MYQNMKKFLGLMGLTAVVALSTVMPAHATGLAAITLDPAEINAFAPKVVAFVVVLCIIGAIIKLTKKAA